MSGSLRRIPLVQGDTLEALAAKYLGYFGRWREIASLNSLRAPYISDRPADWFGPPLTTGILGSPLAALAETVTLAGESSRSVLAGSFFLLEAQAAGGYVWEAPIVKGFDQTTGVVTFVTPLQHGWHAGTRYRVCPADIATRVARPGESLALPDVVGNAGAVVDGSADLILLYGRDLGLDRTGRLALAGGDLAVVEGVANAGQALRFRALLPHGSCALHPTEGNRTLELIGNPQGDATAALARDYTRAALLTDSRVLAIPRVTSREVDFTALELTADVTLAATSQQVRVNEVIGGR